jgi:anti-sigma B factor antagonist
MKIALSDDILSISEIKELGEANSETFRDRVRAALPASDLKAIEIDLAQTEFVDSCGLAALITVHKWAAKHNGNGNGSGHGTGGNDGSVPVRLLNPPPPVQQILELTRLHRTFEIVKR